MTRGLASGGLLAMLAIGAVSFVRAPYARAQAFDVQRPAVIVVGTPAGAGVARVDAARTGFSRTLLPATQVHTSWRASAGLVVEQAPVVDEQGTTYVLGNRGEIVAINSDGEERWRLATGAGQPGPGAITADGTLVFVDDAGQATAIRDGVLRWQTRFGQRGSPCPAPLPLDDGGVVVATDHELALLDAAGDQRARAALPEPSTAPLVAVSGRVTVVSTTGNVWTWLPGSPELVRAGAFGSPIDKAAALADDHTLLGVAMGQAHISTVDISRGTTALRAAAPAGVWLGPPAMRAGTAYLIGLTTTAEMALAIDSSGAELGRALLAVHLPPVGDAGATGIAIPPHAGPLVDAAGTMAFATTEGGVGVVTGLGTGNPTVEVVADACPAPGSTSGRSEPPVAGLAPLPPSQFVAVCATGTVIAVGSGPAGRRGRR